MIYWALLDTFWSFFVYLSPVSPPTIRKCHSKLIVIKLVSLDQGPCFSVKILEVVSKVFYLISKLCQVLKIQKNPKCCLLWLWLLGERKFSKKLSLIDLEDWKNNRSYQISTDFILHFIFSFERHHYNMKPQLTEAIRVHEVVAKHVVCSTSCKIQGPLMKLLSSDVGASKNIFSSNAFGKQLLKLRRFIRWIFTITST